MDKNKLFEHLDKSFGIGANNIFYQYKNEKKLMELIGYNIIVYKTFPLEKDISFNEVIPILKEWVDGFKKQRLTNISLTEHEKKVIAWIDKNFGKKAKNKFSDFESGNELFECVQEAVGMNERLTQMCGVGPLIPAITYWIQEFEESSLEDNQIKDNVKKVKP